MINFQAIRSPCGFLGFDFTLCCEDQNQPPITTPRPTTPRPTTQQPTTPQPTTPQPTTQRPTTAAPQLDNCGTNANNRIVGGTESRWVSGKTNDIFDSFLSKASKAGRLAMGCGPGHQEHLQQSIFGKSQHEEGKYIYSKVPGAEFNRQKPQNCFTHSYTAQISLCWISDSGSMRWNAAWPDDSSHCSSLLRPVRRAQRGESSCATRG